MSVSSGALVVSNVFALAHLSQASFDFFRVADSQTDKQLSRGGHSYGDAKPNPHTKHSHCRSPARQILFPIHSCSRLIAVRCYAFRFRSNTIPDEALGPRYNNLVHKSESCCQAIRRCSACIRTAREGSACCRTARGSSACCRGSPKLEAQSSEPEA
ncbi:hypothetical protein BX070DRAFT_66337 [Coemansia spiralis]|nr:hypothetical protein BX070DRAFT_66337 [Coemansia spiralis]